MSTIAPHLQSLAIASSPPCVELCLTLVASTVAACELLDYSGYASVVGDCGDDITKAIWMVVAYRFKHCTAPAPYWIFCVCNSMIAFRAGPPSHAVTVTVGGVHDGVYRPSPPLPVLPVNVMAPVPSAQFLV